LVHLALVVAGCGDVEKRYNDDRIVERLHLKQSESGDTYAVEDDPFCEVEKKLLNDADEVETAIDRDKIGLVVASKAGNAGITGVAPFLRECADEARDRLNKLDPVEN
jgi:hypothetical protein